MPCRTCARTPPRAAASAVPLVDVRHSRRHPPLAASTAGACRRTPFPVLRMLAIISIEAISNAITSNVMRMRTSSDLRSSRCRSAPPSPGESPVPLPPVYACPPSLPAPGPAAAASPSTASRPPHDGHSHRRGSQSAPHLLQLNESPVVPFMTPPALSRRSSVLVLKIPRLAAAANHRLDIWYIICRTRPEVPTLKGMP